MCTPILRCFLNTSLRRPSQRVAFAVPQHLLPNARRAGFVGAVLFIALLATSYGTCRALRKRSRRYNTQESGHSVHPHVRGDTSGIYE